MVVRDCQEIAYGVKADGIAGGRTGRREMGVDRESHH
jgi:hypothetical protein